MTDTLRIRLRDDDSNSHDLEADRVTLQFYSSCARGLPAAAEEWDLSQLLLDGQPVQRATVVCWLNAISQHMNYEPLFEGQPDSPAHTMAGLAQLLAFADAVGTIKGLLRAIDAQVSAAALVATVQMGEQQLQLVATSCYVFDADEPLKLWCNDEFGMDHEVATASSAADKRGLRQQYTQQVEALLYLAYKLQLPQLQGMVHRCIASNSCNNDPLLDTADDMRAVASARVVDAAVGCGAAQDAIIISSSNVLCAFSSECDRRQVFKPLGLTAAQKEPIQCKAKLVEDFACFKKGQVVNVRLDLFSSSCMHVTPDAPDAGPLSFVVNLAVGRQPQSRSES